MKFDAWVRRDHPHRHPCTCRSARTHDRIAVAKPHYAWYDRYPAARQHCKTAVWGGGGSPAER